MSTVKILSILEAASIEAALKENESDLTKTLMTKQDGADLRTELSTKIAESKADVIKWMFLFWIGQMAVTATIVKLLIP
jgi:hypothetical protein